MKALLRSACGLFLTLVLASCVVYEPYPAPVPVDPVERPWNAALGAMQDAGLAISGADRATGIMQGTRGSTVGVISIRRLMDGRVEVKIDTKDPDNRDPGLSERLTQAYNYRMGR